MFSFSVSNGCEFNQGNCILLAAEVLYLEPEASYPRIAAPAETLYKAQGSTTAVENWRKIPLKQYYLKYYLKFEVL